MREEVQSAHTPQLYIKVIYLLKVQSVKVNVGFIHCRILLDTTEPSADYREEIMW